MDDWTEYLFLAVLGFVAMATLFVCVALYGIHSSVLIPYCVVSILGTMVITAREGIRLAFTD